MASEITIEQAAEYEAAITAATVAAPEPEHLDTAAALLPGLHAGALDALRYVHAKAEPAPGEAFGSVWRAELVAYGVTSGGRTYYLTPLGKAALYLLEHSGGAA